MATILGQSDYAAIRAAIDATLDATTLPDTVIELPIYLNLADQEIKRRVTDWSAIITADGDDAVQVKAAAVYLTASLLAGSVPALSAETFPDYAYRANVQPPTERAAALRARADAAIALVVGTESSDRLPTFFTIARGTRVSGRWCDTGGGS